MMAAPRMPRLPRRGHTRGVAAVEFAIVAMLLVTMLLGASEFGRAMYQYNAVVKSARAAARHLSLYAAGDATAKVQAACIVVYGSTACSGTVLVPGLTTTMVSICDALSCAGTHQRQGTGRGVVDLVTVRVSGVVFQPIASWILPAFTFDAVEATMIQGI